MPIFNRKKKDDTTPSPTNTRESARLNAEEALAQAEAERAAQEAAQAEEQARQEAAERLKQGRNTYFRKIEEGKKRLGSLVRQHEDKLRLKFLGADAEEQAPDRDYHTADVLSKEEWDFVHYPQDTTINPETVATDYYIRTPAPLDLAVGERLGISQIAQEFNLDWTAAEAKATAEAAEQTEGNGEEAGDGSSNDDKTTTMTIVAGKQNATPLKILMEHQHLFTTAELRRFTQEALSPIERGEWLTQLGIKAIFAAYNINEPEAEEINVNVFDTLKTKYASQSLQNPELLQAAIDLLGMTGGYYPNSVASAICVTHLCETYRPEEDPLGGVTPQDSALGKLINQIFSQYSNQVGSYRYLSDRIAKHQRAIMACGEMSQEAATHREAIVAIQDIIDRHLAAPYDTTFANGNIQPANAKLWHALIKYDGVDSTLFNLNELITTITERYPKQSAYQVVDNFIAQSKPGHPFPMLNASTMSSEQELLSKYTRLQIMAINDAINGIIANNDNSATFKSSSVERMIYQKADVILQAIVRDLACFGSLTCDWFDILAKEMKLDWDRDAAFAKKNRDDGHRHNGIRRKSLYAAMLRRIAEVAPKRGDIAQNVFLDHLHQAMFLANGNVSHEAQLYTRDGEPRVGTYSSAMLDPYESKDSNHPLNKEEGVEPESEVSPTQGYFNLLLPKVGDGVTRRQGKEDKITEPPSVKSRCALQFAMAYQKMMPQHAVEAPNQERRRFRSQAEIDLHANRRPQINAINALLASLHQNGIDWWPELDIEVNLMGVVALNPISLSNVAANPRKYGMPEYLPLAKIENDQFIIESISVHQLFTELADAAFLLDADPANADHQTRLYQLVMRFEQSMTQLHKLTIPLPHHFGHWFNQQSDNTFAATLPLKCAERASEVSAQESAWIALNGHEQKPVDFAEQMQAVLSQKAPAVYPYTSLDQNQASSLRSILEAIPNLQLEAEAGIEYNRSEQVAGFAGLTRKLRAKPIDEIDYANNAYLHFVGSLALIPQSLQDFHLYAERYLPESQTWLVERVKTDGSKIVPKEINVAELAYRMSMYSYREMSAPENCDTKNATRKILYDTVVEFYEVMFQMIHRGSLEAIYNDTSLLEMLESRIPEIFPDHSGHFNFAKAAVHEKWQAVCEKRGQRPPPPPGPVSQPKEEAGQEEQKSDAATAAVNATAAAATQAQEQATVGALVAEEPGAGAEVVTDAADSGSPSNSSDSPHPETPAEEPTSRPLPPPPVSQAQQQARPPIFSPLGKDQSGQGQAQQPPAPPTRPVPPPPPKDTDAATANAAGRGSTGDSAQAGQVALDPTNPIVQRMLAAKTVSEEQQSDASSDWDTGEAEATVQERELTDAQRAERRLSSRGVNLEDLKRQTSATAAQDAAAAAQSPEARRRALHSEMFPTPTEITEASQEASNLHNT